MSDMTMHPDPNADPANFQIRDPRMRALMGLPPMPLSGFNIQPLGGSPGQQGAPQQQFGGYNIGAPPSPPIAPDYSQNQGLANQARHQTFGPNQFQVQQNQLQGTGAGLGAELGAMPTVNPGAAQYNPLTYNPTALPQYSMPATPTRPAPGVDPQSRLLAMLGGIVDPRGAGNYNAQPLLAGVDVANRQYQDRLTQYQQAMQQEELNYQAQLAQANTQNAAHLHNVTGQNAANVALGQQEYANQQARAGLIGQQTAAETTATGLGPLGQQQGGAQQAQATLAQALEDIQLQERGYQNAISVFGHQETPYYGAASRLGSAQIRGDATTDAAGTRADATTGAAQIRANASTANTTANNATKVSEGALNRAADAASAPTGAAAKDPATQNAFKLYQGFASDLAKTERILQQGWKMAGGANVADMGAFSRWMHSDPVWQRQAQTANTAYQDYLSKAAAVNTPTPGTSGGTVRPAAPPRYPVVPGNAPTVGGVLR